MRGFTKVFTVTLGLLLMFVLATQADGAAGKELFDEKCSDCHTIGGGDAGGPDLAHVADKRPEAWLARIIMEPDKLITDKDPAHLELIKQYGYAMPDLGVSRKEALEIIAFLKSAVPGEVKTTDDRPQPEKIAVTPALVARGKALFTGQSPFAQGGAPCTACHLFRRKEITGGTLAPDLTGLYGRMGEERLRGVLKGLNFPMMKRIYGDKPLSDAEIIAITAFVKEADGGKKEGGVALFPIAGFGLFGFCLIVLSLYKRRIR